jgi:steroid delta-isomerase-like uncharacterized protein
MEQVMHSERNKTIIRTFIEAVNEQDWDRLDDMVAEHFIRHSHAGGQPEVRSREELKTCLRREFETFPDARESLEDLLAEGDRVAARHRFRGTQLGAMGPYPPTGRVMTADYLAIYRVEDGRIAEAWVEWDNLSGLVQLGHYRPPQGTTTAI